MGWLTDDQIRLIDQRIAAARLRDRAQGTLTGRDGTGPGGAVLFDGSTAQVPVKVVGQAAAVRPGHRVLLDRYGTEWLVTSTFSYPQLGRTVASTIGPSTIVNLATTGAFQDLADFAPATFTKYHDISIIAYQYNSMSFSDVAVTKWRFGLRFTQTEGETSYTAADYDVNGYAMATGVENVHIPVTSVGVITGVPAGTYTVQARWKRTAGTGQVRWNLDDTHSFILTETLDPASPFL